MRIINKLYYILAGILFVFCLFAIVVSIIGYVIGLGVTINKFIFVIYSIGFIIASSILITKLRQYIQNKNRGDINDN